MVYNLLISSDRKSARIYVLGAFLGLSIGGIVTSTILFWPRSTPKPPQDTDTSSSTPNYSPIYSMLYNCNNTPTYINYDNNVIQCDIPIRNSNGDIVKLTKLQGMTMSTMNTYAGALRGFFEIGRCSDTTKLKNNTKHTCKYISQSVGVCIEKWTGGCGPYVFNDEGISWKKFNINDVILVTDNRIQCQDTEQCITINSTDHFVPECSHACNMVYGCAGEQILESIDSGNLCSTDTVTSGSTHDLD